MATLRQALIALRRASLPPQVMHGPIKPPVGLLKANADWHRRKHAKRPAAHFADVGRVMRDSMRNPSTSGSMHHTARTVDAAGSDTGRAYKLSAPQVKFGWSGRRDSQAHPDQRRDYWLP